MTTDRQLTPEQQAELERALGVAEDAGFDSFRVELAADGAATIIVGGSARDTRDPDPYGGLLD